LLHATYLAQSFTHFAKWLRMVTLLRNHLLFTQLLHFEDIFTFLPSQHLHMDCINQCKVHVLPRRLLSIGSYPSGQMHVRIIPSLIFICQFHYRPPKPRMHHPPICALVFKAFLVCTPPPCGCSAQYPFQRFKALLFRHLAF